MTIKMIRLGLQQARAAEAGGQKGKALELVRQAGRFVRLDLERETDARLRQVLNELGADCERYAAKLALAHSRAFAPSSAFAGPASRPAGRSGGEDEESGGPSSWILPTVPPDRLREVKGLEDAKESIRLAMIEPFRHPEKALKYRVPAPSSGSPWRRARCKLGTWPQGGSHEA